ncbi:retrovirus-related pol polyprotein from transposon TNT 1-94 [Tanacetum coccineum]
MCDNDIQNDQNVVECDDERVALANLITNLKLDVDENKKIQRQLKKANASLNQELTECKSILAKTSRTLGESNSIRDSYLVALQNKQTELEKYMALNDRTVDYDKLEQLVDQAWVKHSKYHFCAPTAQDMEILIKTCLMPLTLKTQNDSFAFVHELKKEMHADLKYVEYLENEIDELESGVAHRTNVSRPQPRSTQMKDKVMPNTNQVKFKKTEVEDHHRISSISNQTKSVTACTDILNSRTSNVNVVSATCGKCVFNLNHDACVSKYLNDMNARTKKPKGNDLLIGNHRSDLYTISLQETTSSTTICLMAKASPTQAWLWHRRLSHLNLDYINLLSKKDVVIGLPKLKYVKDQLCFSCEVSKAKRSSFKTNTIPSSKGQLNLLHMDLCGPMRVASINGKKYILVIVDDYSRYTWTLFLRSKDETPEFLKDFLMMIQRNLQAPVISVRTDRGTEFLNKTLNAFFKEEGIEHQTSTPQTPKQNGVSDYDSSDPVPQLQNVSPSADTTIPSQQELDLLFGPLYDEFFIMGTSRVNKSSSTVNSAKQYTHPSTNIHPTSEPSIPTNILAKENNNNEADDTEHEFTNPFSTCLMESITFTSYALSWKSCQGDSLNLPDHRCVKSKVCDWYWKRKDVTQGDWVEMNVDPYEAIRQAYLDGTDTESEPFEDPIDTETPESPLAIAPPIPLSESTPPVLVPILRRTARMVVRVPHAMSSGLSACMAEVAAMFESAFRKRFRSSYKSSPSVSPPDLPSRKRYRDTSELVKDSEMDDDEEDEEIEESMDFDSVSEDAEDEGPTIEDEDPAAEDKGLTAGVEGPGMDDEGYGLDDESHGIDDEGHSVESDGLGLEEEEEVYLEGSRSAPKSERPKRVSAFRQPTLTIWIDPEDCIIYIDILDYPPPAPPVQTPPSPEWTSATPVVDETEGFLTELGAQVQMQGGLISDHVVQLEELSPALFERYDRDIGELFTRSRAYGGDFLPEVRRMPREQPCGMPSVMCRFWNGLPRMGRAEMVDQARFA